MKRVIIVHGWEGQPDKEWMPWLKSELEQKGLEVIVPQMPNAMSPKLDEWLSYMNSIIQEPDEHTFLVGHSLGCITILRYLESLKDQKVGGAVLVAGFGEDLEYEGYKGELSNFFRTPINWQAVKKSCDEFIAINSKDDPWVLIKNNNLFREKLNSESIVVDSMRHFNMLELPLALEAVLKISK